MLVFSLRYARDELRRRWTRALITALGLAAAVGLVVAITALSTGFNRAGQQVLAPLGRVGTDVLVTQAAGSSSQELIDANRSVVTNLAALGRPGQRFTHDFFLLPSTLPLPAAIAVRAAGLPHVSAVAGALVVLGSHQTGVVPTMVASLRTGGTTVHQVHKPADLTPSEAAQVRSCILTDGGLKDIAASAGSPSSALPGQVERCLPVRFRQYVASVTVPAQTVRQVLDPPQTDIRARPYTAAGVDAAHPDEGLVTRRQVVAGQFLRGEHDVLADTSYASANGLHVGSSVPVNGTEFHVVGLVAGGIGGQSANLYFPLPALQALADQPQRVDVLLVRADSAEHLAAVQAELHRLLPGAHLATATQLAERVKGSLDTAKRLTHRFGGALAVVVLLASFLVTVLLTLGSVAKRVREIGTLRAIGWSRRRVVGQLVLETLGIGAAGAVLGVGLGAAMAAGITHFAPSLDAHSTLSGGTAALARAVGAAQQHQVAAALHVRVVASVSAASVGAGAALALLGGLLAGAIGGWRAVCLSPSVALRDIG